MPYTLIVCGALLIFSVGLDAANKEKLHYSSLTVADGLVNNTILSIHRDSRGFMWFGTAKGISRYDGQRFYNYEKKSGSKNSLQGNNIFDIEEDGDGTLWFATGVNLAALSRKDIETGDFKNFELPGLFDIECSRNDSLLWLGTLRGLHMLEKATGETRKYNFLSPHDRINDFEIRALLEDSEGRLWIGTNFNGLFVKEKDYITHFENAFWDSAQQKYFGIQCLYQDRAGRVWASSNGGGLIRIESHLGEPFKIRQLNSLSKKPNKIESDFLAGSIEEDKSGSIWCATDGNGVMQISPDSNMKYYRPGDEGFCNNRIMTLLLDDDILWIGTRRDGIIKAVRNLPHFSVINPFNQRQSARAPEGSNVWTINTSLKTNHYWLGLDGAISLAKQQDDQITIIETFFFDSLRQNSYRNLQIRKVIEYAPGKLYLYSLGAGVIDLNWQNKGYRCLKLKKGQNQQAITPYLYCALADSGAIWAGGNRSGLIRLQPKTNTYKEYLFKRPHRRRFITTLNQSSILKHILYVGTWDNGLVLFDKYKGKFRQYKHSKIKNTTCFMETSDSIVWIGTYGNGLVRAKLQNSSKSFPDFEFKHYDIEDGLPSNHVLGMLPDDYGCLWISTDKGITRFNIDEGCFGNYSSLNNISVQAFNMGARLRSENTFFFGSDEGLVSFNQVQPSPAKPPSVVLTSFSKFGVEQPVAGLAELPALELSWRDDFFALRFSALDYYKPQNNLYAYMLENFDEDWIYSRNRAEAVYTNLDPGEYTFRVKAANALGVWNENGVRLPLTITAPFWKTKFFYFSLTLLVMVAFYSWHRLKLKQSAVIEAKLKADLSQSLHDDTSGYLNEIRRLAVENTSLSVASQNGEKVKDKIDAVSFAIRDAIFGLDASKSSLRDVAIYLASYSQKLFDDKEIAFRLKGLDDSFKHFALPNIVRTNLIRLFKEAINNIAKHSAECRNVKLQMAVKHGFLFMRLTDDGNGFERKQTAGFGLENMQKRAQALGGRLIVQSRPLDGTTVQFRVKLRQRKLQGVLKVYGKRN